MQTPSNLTPKTLAKGTVIVCAIAAVAALFVVRFNDVVGVLGTLWDVLFPFFLGFIFAYLINLIMQAWEHIWFPHTNNAIVNRTRRGVCLLLAIITIAAIITAVVWLVASEMRAAAGAVIVGIEAALNSLAAFASTDPNLSALLQIDTSQWTDALRQAVSSLGGAGGAASTVVRWGGNIAHAVFNVFIALIFMLYVLLNKERVINGGRNAAQALLPESWFNSLTHIMRVTNDSFTRFVTGQCLEACILGLLCALGMTVLGFPYAGSIGLCVGVTSLVPFVGAWIGGIVGAFIIASVSIEQAALFVVFLVILQQIEGHLIYPNVVGSQVGLPGIWTFFAVVAGGSLFGVAGILLGVPTVSTVRTLVLEWNEKRKAQKAEALAAATATNEAPNT